MLREDLDDDHVWTRIADPAWVDPLDASYASKMLGGRWTAPAGPASGAGPASAAGGSVAAVPVVARLPGA